MKSIFRKVAVMAIAVFTMSMAANAQEKGDMAAGGNQTVISIAEKSCLRTFIQKVISLK
jgi:hypothetical protein